MYEGHTLIPFLEAMSRKFNLVKPVVIADSGLLTKKNIAALQEEGYEYIIGARLKNESASIQPQIIQREYQDGSVYVIERQEGQRLIVHHSVKRAKKDFYNRRKGLCRLEKRIKSGKLTKSSINNRGYNKYLELDGEIDVKIDYQKFEQDALWDGLKGYATNTKLTNDDVLENYRNLFYIERAFRMSKTDLRIRPIYHRLRHWIEAHICIAFTAYVYKELERVLNEEKEGIHHAENCKRNHSKYVSSYLSTSRFETHQINPAQNE